MCDISKQTDLKERVVYKTVVKHEGFYFSVFCGKLLTTGKVEPLKRSEALWMEELNKWRDALRYLQPEEYLFNPHMVGKVSGFVSKEITERFTASNNKVHSDLTHVTLKVKLGGDIMKGTAKRISYDISERAHTYAGTEILSMEELNP